MCPTTHPPTPTAGSGPSGGRHGWPTSRSARSPGRAPGSPTTGRARSTSCGAGRSWTSPPTSTSTACGRRPSGGDRDSVRTIRGPDRGGSVVANYVLVFKGGGMAETEAEQQAVLAAWGRWYGELGQAVVDGGNPFGPSASVAADGTVGDGGPSGLTGYTILQADGLAAATEMAKGCPVLSSGGSIEVYETFEVM